MVKVTHADDGNVDIKLSKDNWSILKDALAFFQMDDIEESAQTEQAKKLISVVKQIHLATPEDKKEFDDKYKE